MRTRLVKNMDRSWAVRSTVLVFFAVLAIGAAVGYAYVSLGFWAILGVMTGAAAATFLFFSTRALILTIFVAKPFIDMLWFAGTSFAGFNVNASSLLSVVIVIAALMFLAVRRVELGRRLLLPMLAVLAMNVWALAATSNASFGAEYLIRVVCGFPLVFVVPVVVEQLPALNRLLHYFFIAIAVVCVTILLQPLGLLAYSSFDQDYGRATGFYYHPWDVARYMVIVIPLLLAVLDEPGREKMLARWPLWLLLTASLTATYFTFLKAAWITVLFEILLWLFLTRRTRVGLAVLGITVLLVAFPLREGFASVFSDLWKLSDEETRGQALSGRVYLWGEYWSGLRSAGVRQILMGQGYDPAGWTETGAAVHDDYLRILVMNGVVGLVAYLWLMLAALRTLLDAVKTLAARVGIEWRVGLAVMCILAAYLLMGITADPSSYPSMTLYLWLLIGLVIGYARLEREKQAFEPQPGARPGQRSAAQRDAAVGPGYSRDAWSMHP